MLDEFKKVQEQIGTPGVRGWWVRARQTLTDEQWESLTVAAKDWSISHRAIALVLGSWGVKVSPAQVGHWRRRQATDG